MLQGPLKGTKFQVAPGYGLTFAIGHRELHLEAISKIIKPGMTIYDIGANRGHISLLFSKLAGPSGKVLAFEPIAEFTAEFQKNMSCNAVNNVSLINTALSDSVGTVSFEYSDSQSTQGRIQGVEDALDLNQAESRTVETNTLDCVAETQPKPDILKIDVEGAAKLVLAGAPKLLANQRPTVFIELHGPEEQSAVQELLISKGYSAFSLDGEHIPDICDGWHSPLICRASS